MPQAKLLYLLGVSGEMHMSDLVARLGVSLSTVSGLVDRIVDQGLATRRDDPADRRQVVVALTEQGTAFIDRFRELNAPRCASCSASRSTTTSSPASATPSPPSPAPPIGASGRRAAHAPRKDPA